MAKRFQLLGNPEPPVAVARRIADEDFGRVPVPFNRAGRMIVRGSVVCKRLVANVTASI
jgi:hypothetical protein